MKKVKCLIISLCIIIMCSGCKDGSHEITETKNENGNGNVAEVAENLMEYFNTYTAATKYIDAYVELDADAKIESTEWIEHDTNQCLRIRIQYKVQPEGKYRHKEDYFLFCNIANEVINVLQVDYADIELGSGNDFNAHFEDVTFDGNEDLLIHIGSWGSAQHYCAFICENGNYRREESFEAIPNYKVDADKRQIVGTANSIDTETISIYVYDSGKFERMDRVKND
ncbi:MAG: hypothetical protein K2G45_00920 [Lachnospiraceae bacterium]|nr:hypothetical protein [Lachnospiraceae bacterium]